MKKKKILKLDIEVTLNNGVLSTDLLVKPTGTHQLLDPTSCHPYRCKKGIPYSQTLRLNRICSDNNNFDKRCKELKSWLLEKGYSEKMVRKQVLRPREHSRESLLEKVKSEPDQNKLTFNITYYPVFQNVRNILQELHILLTPDKKHQKVFQDIPAEWFRNGKSLKDHLVTVKLPNGEITGRSESCGKGNCQVWDVWDYQSLW